jgi:hypothetical protein
MPSPIPIIEIISQSKQGYSNPYLCEGEDGIKYYVKGQQSHWPQTSIIEWIAAHLARALQLPVADFCLVEISPELLAVTRPELRAIGQCIAFASKQVPRARWFETTDIAKIPDKLQQQLLVFDWWIQNEDRNTGNTNLLFDDSQGSLIVIDHNLAFDQQFSSDNFISLHLFRHHWHTITSDPKIQQQFKYWLLQALPAFEQAQSSMPLSWLESEELLPNAIDLDYFKALLTRCDNDEFWRT